jgi:hypothetical protein
MRKAETDLQQADRHISEPGMSHYPQEMLSPKLEQRSQTAALA